MPSVVSTGQITIVDTNDAKPITAFITASAAPQQVYNKDESTVSYVPDWTSSPLTLTAKVYVGGAGAATDVTANLTGRKWSNDLSTSLGSAVTLAVNTNLTTAAPSKVYYFEGDYTDPATGLVTHVIAQITLNLVKTGTNAVFVQVTGQDVIEQATGSAKNTAVMKAELMRASGADDTVTGYRWTEVLSGAVINQSIASYATKYGFRTTTQANAGSGSALGTNVPAAGSTAFFDGKAIIVGEAAVANFAIYKVEIQDTDGSTYATTFTIYDISDTYRCNLVSSTGDKLQNGQGSTDVYPDVFYGSNRVQDLTGWTFDWKFFDGKTGIQGGFVDTTRTAVAAGRDITSNTASSTAPVISYSGSNITFAANDMVKLVTSAGVAYYYEVSAGGTGTVTLRLPATTSTFLNNTAVDGVSTPFKDPVTLNQFAGGKLFVCKGTGATAGVQSTSGANNNPQAAKITVSGYEIDVKGTVICSANRP
jgi:hypothetical protein